MSDSLLIGLGWIYAKYEGKENKSSLSYVPYVISFLTEDGLMAPIPESNNSINMQSETNKKTIHCVLCILENSESYKMIL